MAKLAKKKSDIDEEVRNAVTFTAPDIGSFELDIKRNEELAPNYDQKPETPEQLKQELQDAHKEAMEKLIEIRGLSAEDITVHYNIKGKDGRGGTMGYYTPENNSITVDESDWEDKERILYHEQQHKNFAHATVKIGGKDVPVKDVPMSLEQRYKLAQADEIGANIAELLSFRQKYVDAGTNKKLSRDAAQLCLSEYSDKPNVKELMNAVKNDNVNITQGDTGNYTFEVDGKTITVEGDQLGEDAKRYLNAYIQNKENFEKIDETLKTKWARDETGMFASYFRSIERGEIDPLSTKPEDMEKEMQRIGGIVSSNWKDKLSEKYKGQCTSYTEDHFERMDLHEMKPNEENYKKALSKALTVGGWDFSNYVKDNLTCPEEIKAIDETIKNSITKEEVIKKAKDKGLNLYSEKKESVEYKIAAYLVANDPKSTEKALETPLEDIPTLKHEWTEEDAKNYQNIVENIEKDLKDNKYRKLFEELKLNEKKTGDELTADELKKLREIRSGIYGDNEDNEDILKTPTLKSIRKIIWKHREIEEARTLRFGIPNDEIEKYKEAYEKVKSDNDTTFEYVNLREVKQNMATIKNGVQRDRSADPKKLAESRDTYYPGDKYTEKIKNLRDDFLTRYHNALIEGKIAAAQQSVQDALKKRELTAAQQRVLGALGKGEEKAPEEKEAKNKTPVNNTLLYANKNQGRD